MVFRKLNIIKILMVLTFIVSQIGCKQESVSVTDFQKAQYGQCLDTYRVEYSHNDIPNWDEIPEEFCEGENAIAAPLGMGMYPLKYNKDKKGNMKQAEFWFYVIWACHRPCTDVYKNKKEGAR